jgi:glucose/arabinose dehydrogenase
MRMRSKAVCLALAAAVAVPAGCSSDDEPAKPKPPRIPAATAADLASMSDEIADDLDAGDVCAAAQRADELSEAVERARLPERFREVEEVATTLVDTVNCPPPPEPEKKDEGKRDGGNGEGGDQESYENAQLDYGQLPPGQAKKIDGGGDE